MDSYETLKEGKTPEQWTRRGIKALPTGRINFRIKKKEPTLHVPRKVHLACGSNRECQVPTRNMIGMFFNLGGSDCARKKVWGRKNKLTFYLMFHAHPRGKAYKPKKKRGPTRHRKR